MLPICLNLVFIHSFNCSKHFWVIYFLDSSFKSQFNMEPLVKLSLPKWRVALGSYLHVVMCPMPMRASMPAMVPDFSSENNNRD